MHEGSCADAEKGVTDVTACPAKDRQHLKSIRLQLSTSANRKLVSDFFFPNGSSTENSQKLNISQVLSKVFIVFFPPQINPPPPQVCWHFRRFYSKAFCIFSQHDHSFPTRCPTLNEHLWWISSLFHRALYTYTTLRKLYIHSVSEYLLCK